MICVDSDSQLGLVAASDRDRVLGYDTGLERERAMQAGINISPPISAWFRPRLDFGTSYNMLRDPNTLGFAREGDSTSDLRIPRRLGNSQTTTAGLTLDIPRAVKLYTDSASFLRGVLGGLQPVDVNFNRSLLSVYDGSAAGASLAYQFGLGGINTFREIGSELATSVGLVTQLSTNPSTFRLARLSPAGTSASIPGTGRAESSRARTSSTEPKSCSPTSPCAGQVSRLDSGR